MRPPVAGLSARALAAGLACALALAGCGASARTGRAGSAGSTPAASTPASATQPATGTATPAVDELRAAEHPVRGEFPAAAGRSLVALARLVRQTATLGAANGTFTPGSQRFAFALTDKALEFIYAPTAVYLAARPDGPAEGPFLARADAVGVAGSYRSRQNAAPGGLQAMYWTRLPLPRSGVFYVLSLTRAGHRLIGATGEVAVALSTPIPSVGQQMPAVATDTLATTHGNVGLLTTRTPPESMHSASLTQVLGRRPVALLVSTPELCQSRVCGPVTDIMVALQRQFGSRITFIHQEVYVGNDPTKGLRPQLKALHLETEPWLFTIDRAGVITARVEGAFGVDEARQALEAALRR